MMLLYVQPDGRVLARSLEVSPQNLIDFNFKDGEFSVEITNNKIRTQLGVCGYGLVTF